jgi:putative ABC transport system ATP-binding protein
MDLGPYAGDYKDESNPNLEIAKKRHQNLKNFLLDMGW